LQIAVFLLYPHSVERRERAFWVSFIRILLWLEYEMFATGSCVECMDLIWWHCCGRFQTL
jgi:hypothetical protein